MDNDTHVLEWSQKQNAMHIHPVEVAIEKNLQSLFACDNSDFIIIAMGTNDHCHSVAKKIRYKLQQRDPGRKHDRNRY